MSDLLPTDPPAEEPVPEEEVPVDGGLQGAPAAPGGEPGPPVDDEEPAPLETTVEVACAVCGATEPMQLRYKLKGGQLVDGANRELTLSVVGTDIVVRLRKNKTLGGVEVEEFHVPVSSFLKT